MAYLSEHFDSSEFRCNCGNCGGGENLISSALIERLEKVFDDLDCGTIIITSGYRCPNHSVSVGGYRNDAHTLGIAADIICNDKNRQPMDVLDMAAAAERAGFGGIGVMNGAIHVDCRDLGGYSNTHWFGNEVTGDNFIPTFQREKDKVKTETKVEETKVEEPKAEVKEDKSKHKVELKVDGVTVFESE